MEEDKPMNLCAKETCEKTKKTSKQMEVQTEELLMLVSNQIRELKLLYKYIRSFSALSSG